MPTPPRRWDDHQLRDAVGSQRSWRGTAARSGFAVHPPGSLRALRARALELDLDTSHFTSQRRWSDAQLRDAISNGSSWAEVLRLLGLTDRGEARARVKGRAVRIGLDTSHLEPQTEVCVAKLSDLSSDIALLSRGAEAYASAWFSLRGASVAKPEHPEPYDLLVILGKNPQRIQVKTTRWRSDYGTWAVNIGRRPYALDKSASRQPSDPDDIDQFFIIDGDLAVYLSPVASLRAGPRSTSARIRRTASVMHRA